MSFFGFKKKMDKNIKLKKVTLTYKRNTLLEI